MQITQEQLNEFEHIWKEDHPEQKISSEELLAIAQRVLTVVDVVYFRD